METASAIGLTLYVPSIEDTAAWYERVLGWKAHFDTFDQTGRCLFGSVMLQKVPIVGFNLSRSSVSQTPEACQHCSIWLYVQDVEALYARVLEVGWATETAPENQFWGERLFRLRDINGYQLVVTQQVEKVGIEEIRKRHQEMMAGST